MKLLFLPIDIDVNGIESFKQLDTSNKITSFNNWWESTAINELTAQQVSSIINQLPFTEVTGLTHKIQTEAVPSHIDVNSSMPFIEGEAENILANEPVGYRFVLHGSTDSIEIFNGVEWVTAHVPTVPCCYVLNSTTGRHRIKYDLNREIIYARGLVDPNAHASLLQRSLLKYKDYAIYNVQR